MELVLADEQRALVAAEASRGTSLAIDPVAEAALWAARQPRSSVRSRGLREDPPEPADHNRVDGEIANVAKAAQAVRVANNTPASVEKFLLSDVFG